ncbi:hypothetical protein AB6A40_004449 [Gnathostoma spinigerum]|uniref:fructose-bisphosphatase n=1 Tax=Gnathostoma spinigerum TaxID=75299 RepID=A0ABD6EDM4_9BILA
MDGSSNINCYLPTGTIFAISKKVDNDEPSLADVLRSGRHLVAAGYAMYSAATFLVLTTGDGVNGFTLDPGIGEFILTHPHMRIPSNSTLYSVNEGYYYKFSKGIQEFIKSRKQSKTTYSLRYVGAMVADITRLLIDGGVFLYPATKSHKNGKLRLLYECNPVSFIVEQAGGIASSGRESILDIEPTSIHQRTPIILGSKDDVLEVIEFIKKYD